MKYDKAFLTGCDYKYEWLLPWFFENYKKYNNTPLIFADFGVKNKDIVKDNAHAIINLTNIKENIVGHMIKVIIKINTKHDSDYDNAVVRGCWRLGLQLNGALA